MLPPSSWERRHRLVYLVTIALGCASGSPGASRPASEEPTLRVADVRFGKVIQDGKIGETTKSFSPGDPILLAAELKLASAGLALRVRWSNGPNLVQEDSVVLAGGPQVLVFPFRKQGPHAEGRYQVFLDVNGEPIGDLTFDVRAPGPEGLAIVRCTITTEGTAEDCVILHPVWFTGDAVLRWLSEQRWIPATRGGKAVNARYVFNFRFSRAS